MPPRKRAASSPLSAVSDGEEKKPGTLPDTPKKRATPRGSATSSARRSTRSNGKSKKEESDSYSDDAMQNEPVTPNQRTRTRTPRGKGGSSKKAKREEGEDGLGDGLQKDKEEEEEKPKPTTPSKSTLAKKLKQLEAYLQTPFPDYPYPTPEQCQHVQDALSKIHGLPRRPEKLVDRAGSAAGCGATPDVLDALIRTILSQNTTSKNSTAAKNAMDEKYGRANHIAVHRASVDDLADTISHGGLANVKSKVIKKVMVAIVDRQISRGEVKDESEIKQLSLDYLHDMNDLDAMKELVSFDGVGPKTASCVLLFCLGRNSFAVDTHVFRITKALGWTPAKANRETAFQHLDVRIPGDNKYPLHSLLVRHGRSCRLCSANGNITEAEVSSTDCPIKAILKARNSGKTPKKRASAKKGEEDGDEDEEEEGGDRDDSEGDIVMPGDIEDKDEDRGKPPIGAPDADSAVKQEETVQWENFGENKEGSMHGL